MLRIYTITVNQEESDPELETALMVLEKELEDLVDEFEASTDADIDLEVN